MQEVKIITLYKNKGERCDCNNYWGISLLNIVRKVFARVVLARLPILADRILDSTQSQCDLRVKTSTVDKMFSARQLQGKCRGE